SSPASATPRARRWWRCMNSSNGQKSQTPKRQITKKLQDSSKGFKQRKPTCSRMRRSILDYWVLEFLWTLEVWRLGFAGWGNASGVAPTGCFRWPMAHLTAKAGRLSHVPTQPLSARFSHPCQRRVCPGSHADHGDSGSDAEHRRDRGNRRSEG